jgi:tetratricopeptide (TPR) repeat protein
MFRNTRSRAHLLLAVCLITLGVSGLERRSTAQQSATDRVIQSLQRRASFYPQDATAFDRLGSAYVQKGRETGDASYYELSRQALLKSLDLVSSGPAAAAAKTQMALVFMAEHRFNDALTWAEDAIELGSGDPTPWGTVGDALTDMGEYQNAEDAYVRLRNPVDPQHPSNLLISARDSRLSYLHFLKGDNEAAASLMRNAIRAAIEARLPTENIAWEYYQLGDELFRTGDITGAEQSYQQGLSIAPQNYRCLAGLGQVRSAQQRFPEAIELYKRALAVVPFPDFAAALGDIYTKMGRSDHAKQQYDLVEFMAYLNAVNKVLYNRELALFYADHNLKLEHSCNLARKELEVRHDVYTWDTLAWSLYKNHKSSEAEQAIMNALRMGTKDAQLFFHAGMIYAGLGNTGKATEYLGRALSTNPQFHVFYADQARTLLAAASQKPDRKQQEARNAAIHAVN